MKHEVRVHRLARLDLSESYEWNYQRAPTTVDRWFNRLREAIRSLESAPDRCPLALERFKVKYEIRELLFGHRPNAYRILFVIDTSVVRVMRIRRGQRQQLTRGQIEEAMQSDDDL